MRVSYVSRFTCDLYLLHRSIKRNSRIKFCLKFLPSFQGKQENSRPGWRVINSYPTTHKAVPSKIEIRYRGESMDKIFDVPKSTIEPTCQREEKQLVEYQSSPPPPSLPPSLLPSKFYDSPYRDECIRIASWFSRIERLLDRTFLTGNVGQGLFLCSVENGNFWFSR